MTLKTRARRIAAPVGAPLRRAAIGTRTRAWPPQSRLFVAGDGQDWAIADDVRQLRRVAQSLGVQVGPESWIACVRNQAIFHASQFGLFGSGWRRDGNRLGVAYLHGRPGTSGMPEFDVCYAELRARHAELDRIQVSCRSMEELVLESGVEPRKVFRIPIGVDLERFPMRRSSGERAAARRELGLPESAFVVGSFQKDGVGWGDGLEPKSIKGPDVLLAALEDLDAHVPELVVLLTGPARGYVIAGLERLRIPHRHVPAADRQRLSALYHAVDAYVVASRDEGGPKAVLEAMASGVPVVSTRVGQAADLIVPGENGQLADVEDAEALAGLLRWVADAPADELSALVRRGRETAEQTSYDALRPRWAELLSGFVAMRGGA
jgi:glycosyltransferase involved in cell wall biosynthesis